MLKRSILFLMTLLSLLLPILSHASTTTINPLPGDKAFVLNVSLSQTDSLIATWDIAPNYYLYQEKFNFHILSPKTALLGRIQMPEGIPREDEYLGKHHVFQHSVTIPIPIANNTDEPIKLKVDYQGCSAHGFCYPPMTKEIIINGFGTNAASIQIKSESKLAAAEETKELRTPDSSVTQSEQSKAERILTHHNLPMALLLFFSFGILLAFTPCVLPMLPILSGIIVGQGKNITTRKAFALSLTYVISMSVTFAIAGLFVGLLGKNIQAALQSPAVIISFSIVFIILALSMFGAFELRMPRRLEERVTALSNQQSGGTYVGVAIMGVLATLIISPCVSAPLVGALAYIGNTGNAIFGGSALFFLGLGMGLPLLIVGTAFGKYLPQAGAWMDTVKAVFGILLLGIAIWLLARVLPASLILFLWGLLAVIAAIYGNHFSKQSRSPYNHIGKAFSIVFLIYGGSLIVGSGMGHENPLQPLASPLARNVGNSNGEQQLKFVLVKTIADAEQQLLRAKADGKPVMLDFYASWCSDCKAIAATTFKDPKVIQALSSYVLLQVDVTENTQQVKDIEQHFGVIAPPTMIFFDKNGNEVKDRRIVGLINAREFLAQMW